MMDYQKQRVLSILKSFTKGQTSVDGDRHYMGYVQKLRRANDDQSQISKLLLQKILLDYRKAEK